jgi:ribosomal protein S18 acetylase RimI-like enzyme
MSQIRPMQDKDAVAVARLHAQSITEGFLGKLGRRFLRQLYLGIAHDEGSRVLVAEEKQAVAGFCAYSRDVAAMYRRVLRARVFRLAWGSLPRSLNPAVIKEVFDTLRYPAKQSAKRLPAAEILSIAVAADARGTGVGKRLLHEVIELARREGQPAIKVLAGAKLEGANRFYRAGGFDLATQIIQHGEPLNVYVKQLAPEV